MSEERRRQWAQRLDRLQALKEQFARVGRYDRAHKAYLAIQQLYDRWANEMFAAHR